MRVLRINMPARAINPRIGLKPNGTWKMRSVGTTPASPKGAVRIVMVRADKDLTWKMITTSVQTNMIGNTLADAAFALADYCALAPTSILYPSGSLAIMG